MFRASRFFLCDKTTVKDLIEILQQLPEDYHVLIAKDEEAEVIVEMGSFAIGSLSSETEDDLENELQENSICLIPEF